MLTEFKHTISAYAEADIVRKFYITAHPRTTDFHPTILIHAELIYKQRI